MEIFFIMIDNLHAIITGLPIWLWMAFFVLLILAIGSFLNVLIYRLPIMLEQEWAIDCREFLSKYDRAIEDFKLNLFFPRSHCVNCKQKLSFLDNIPLLSYIFVRGKCRYCHTNISFVYPLVELITLVLSLYLLFMFGLTAQFFAILLFTYLLIAMSFIDFRYYYLPDNLTLTGLWIGLILNSQNLFVSLHSAVFGAIAGYLSLWLLYWTFKLITGKAGLGHGDFKLLAMFGAWMGTYILPGILILSSVIGIIFTLVLVIFLKRELDKPLPFGPYLAISGWIALVFNHQVIGYLNLWY